MKSTSEGILPAHHDVVKSLVRSIEVNGAAVTCVIGFGSRAMGSASSESDFDILFLIDFNAGDPFSLSDEVLLRTKHEGQATTEMSGPVGDVHLFLYNIKGFRERLITYHDMASSHLFTGIANSGVVIHGNEPVIDGQPLREYIKDRLEKVTQLVGDVKSPTHKDEG